MPRLKIEKIGYGLGSPQPCQQTERPAGGGRRNRGGRRKESPGGYATDTVTQIETNIDDLSPEITGSLLDRLLAAGALDAFFTPAQMKKNRPGVLLTVLCDSGLVDTLSTTHF